MGGQGEAYSLDELIMTTIARQVKDGTFTAVGTLSPIPAAGCLLASLTRAPAVKLLMLGDPRLPLDRGSSQLFDLAQQGRVDLFFLSFVQMDAAANLNLTYIGDPKQPKVRFPGGAGSSMLYHMVKRIILFKASHSKRDFVPRVDFVTASGFGAKLDGRQRLGGPSKVITNLAVLDVDMAAQEISLQSVHPGVTAQEVLDNTGFSLKVPEQVPETTPPDAQELELLRGKVRTRLAEIYPEYARKWEQQSGG